MATDTKTMKASCLCGAAKHEIALKASDYPLKGYLCHCNSCRRMTGSLALTVVFLPTYYEPAPAVLDNLTGFAFSKKITQYFCTTCGCHMLARCLKDGDDPDSLVSWDATTGSLERIEGVVDWQGHGFVQDTLDGGFADFLTELHGKKVDRWPGDFGKGKKLTLPWTSPSKEDMQPSPDDKLQYHCKCGGVEFWLSRPTPRSALVEKYWPDDPPTDVSDQPPPSEDEAFYFRDQGTKYLAGLCACNSCRLASGMEITTWAFVPTINISLDKDGKTPWSGDFGTLKKYESSPGAYRHFCSTCGAIVFYDAEGRMWLKDVAMGLVVSPEGVKSKSWFGWRTRRLGYRDDAIPRAESFAIAVENGLREWEKRRTGRDLSGVSRSGGAP